MAPRSTSPYRFLRVRSDRKGPSAAAYCQNVKRTRTAARVSTYAFGLYIFICICLLCICSEYISCWLYTCRRKSTYVATDEMDFVVLCRCLCAWMCRPCVFVLCCRACRARARFVWVLCVGFSGFGWSRSAVKGPELHLSPPTAQLVRALFAFMFKCQCIYTCVCIRVRKASRRQGVASEHREGPKGPSPHI